jgi:hypothetical protein
VGGLLQASIFRAGTSSGISWPIYPQDCHREPSDKEFGRPGRYFFRKGLPAWGKEILTAFNGCRVRPQVRPAHPAQGVRAYTPLWDPEQFQEEGTGPFAATGPGQSWAQWTASLETSPVSLLPDRDHGDRSGLRQLWPAQSMVGPFEKICPKNNAPKSVRGGPWPKLK